MKALPVKAMTKSVVKRERWEGVRERDRADPCLALGQNGVGMWDGRDEAGEAGR